MERRSALLVRVAAKSVGHKALQCSNRDRRIDILSAAGHFARRAANASADRGQRIRAAGDQVGVLETAFGNRADIAAGVGVDRAGILTLDLPLPIFGRGDLYMVALHVHGLGSPNFKIFDAHKRRILYLRLSEKSSCVAWPALTVALAVLALSFFGLGYQALTEYSPGGAPFIS
jgi:hypothetical protein